MKAFLKYLYCTLIISLIGCRANPVFNPSENLDYCLAQASKTLQTIPPEDSLLPRNIDRDKTEWHFVPGTDWTSGFWPGILWLLYEYTGDEKWRMEANRFTRLLTPLSARPAHDHDLGFQMYCSFGNGYRLTQNPEYKAILLRTADTLATLFNPRVGTILSWPGMKKDKNGLHNTIIDNMMNLELLFWASKNGGPHSLYDIAVRHAETTMKNQFRPDFSTYHAILYNDSTGARIKGQTHQGYADESMWARGQAWAIYGYTMTYRETRDPKFLEVAQNAANLYLKRLPEDMIPYWDFDAPNIPNEPKDASAAAITASALLELSTLVSDKGIAKNYYEKAVKMLTSLSSEKYQSLGKNSAFLLHCTGHKPAGTEIDASMIYGDYYYLEALLRLEKMKN